MLVAPNVTVIPVAPLLREILGSDEAVPALEVTVPLMVNVWPPGVLSLPPLAGNARVMPLAKVAPSVKVALPVAPFGTWNVPDVNVGATANVDDPVPPQIKLEPSMVT